MQKYKNCALCNAFFIPQTKAQVYCSAQCREAAKYFKRRYGKDFREAEKENAAAVKEWHRRYDRGIKKCVCKQCLIMFWDQETKEFCSTECKKYWEAVNHDNSAKVP